MTPRELRSCAVGGSPRSHSAKSPVRRLIEYSDTTGQRMECFGTHRSRQLSLWWLTTKRSKADTQRTQTRSGAPEAPRLVIAVGIGFFEGTRAPPTPEEQCRLVSVCCVAPVPGVVCAETAIAGPRKPGTRGASRAGRWCRSVPAQGACSECDHVCFLRS
jgi:hypothetical protein